MEAKKNDVKENHRAMHSLYILCREETFSNQTMNTLKEAEVIFEKY